MAKVDLSIIIVSWNVWDLLRACLTSIEANSHPNTASNSQQKARLLETSDARASFEVIVVDNDSSDATPDLAPTLFPWINFVASGRNLGFTGGNNLGYAHASGEFIYFLNPDTELTGDSLWVLFKALADDPTVGVVGPRLQYTDGQRQNNRRRFPDRFTGFWESTWLGQLWPRNPWVRKMHMADWPDTIRHDVDWLVGAALCIRRSAIEQVIVPGTIGPFDEAFFMYSEELDLCRRIKSKGWRIVYLPDALVIHYEGRSSEQVLAHRHIQFNTSKVLYHRKYFGSTWAELLRTYLLFEYRIQIVVEQIKIALRHKTDLRRIRLNVYHEVLASKLESSQTKEQAAK